MATPIRLSFSTLDVFTTERYAGNPLAVVRVPQDQTLTQEQKQLIAREFNLSETVFLHDSSSGTPSPQHRIDIFMTDRELPFAGHPTIGSACYLSILQLAADNGAEPKGELLLKAGIFPYRYDMEKEGAFVEISHDVHTHRHQIPRGDAVKAGVSQLVAEHISAPIPVFSIVKELTFALIQVPTRDILSSAAGALDAAHFDAELDVPYYKNGFLGTYYFFEHGKRDDGTVNLSTRMMNKTFEDPATGSAASALTAFLALRYFGEQQNVGDEDFEVKFDVEQGVDMGRRSRILTTVTIDRKKGTLKSLILGGSAVLIMNGVLTI